MREESKKVMDDRKKYRYLTSTRKEKRDSRKRKSIRQISRQETANRIEGDERKVQMFDVHTKRERGNREGRTDNRIEGDERLQWRIN